MVSVEVVIPWRAERGDADRWLAREYVGRRYDAWPNYLLTFAGLAADEPWVKARAVMPAVRSSSADVIVVADADVFCAELQVSVADVIKGAPWAIPHRGVHRLTREGSRAVYAGAPWREQETTERPYLGIEGGGIVVAEREALLTVPLDPRFIGWGQEDESWGMALRCLLGPPARAKGALVHLYHDPPPRLTRSRGSIENWNLRTRYAKAREDSATMAAIISEAAAYVGT